MNIEKITVGMKVAHIPRNVIECQEAAEYGEVSSIGSDSCGGAPLVFVRFDESVKRFGWNGSIAQACRPEDLYPLMVVVD